MKLQLGQNPTQLLSLSEYDRRRYKNGKGNLSGKETTLSCSN